MFGENREFLWWRGTRSTDQILIECVSQNDLLLWPLNFLLHGIEYDEAVARQARQDGHSVQDQEVDQYTGVQRDRCEALS